MNKKINKVLSLSLSISALAVVTPIVLASCSTTTNQTPTPSASPEQIIDFNKYQSSVHTQDKDRTNKRSICTCLYGTRNLSVYVPIKGNSLTK